MKNMILTSSLYESIKLVKKILNEKTASKKILFIPTATNVDGYKKYIHLTQKVFEDIGYEVDNFDVSVFPEEVVKEKFNISFKGKNRRGINLYWRICRFGNNNSKYRICFCNG